jgi:hypothetical protein
MNWRPVAVVEVERVPLAKLAPILKFSSSTQVVKRAT